MFFPIYSFDVSVGCAQLDDSVFQVESNLNIIPYLFSEKEF